MNGMIALRTILFFILTSLLSAVVGLCLVVAVHPGDPDTKAEMNTTTTNLLADKKGDIMDNFLDLGRNLVPDNLFQAAFETVSDVVTECKFLDQKCSPVGRDQTDQRPNHRGGQEEADISLRDQHAGNNFFLSHLRNLPRLRGTSCQASH